MPGNNQPPDNCSETGSHCSMDFFLTSINYSDTIFYRYPGEMLTPWILENYFLTIVGTYILTFVFGLVGNISVVLVILSDKTSRNVTNVFLVSLAVADLLLLTICAPLDVAHYFVVHWDRDGTVCKLAAYAETVSAFASVFNLLAVTIERY